MLAPGHTLALRNQSQAQDETLIKERLLGGTLVEEVIPQTSEDLDSSQLLTNHIVRCNKPLMDESGKLVTWNPAEVNQEDSEYTGGDGELAAAQYRKGLYNKAEKLMQQYLTSFARQNTNDLLFESHGVEYFEGEDDQRLDLGHVASNMNTIMALLGKDTSDLPDDGSGRTSTWSLKRANLRIEKLRRELDRQQHNVEKAYQEVDDLKAQIRAMKRREAEGLKPKPYVEVNPQRSAEELEQRLMFLHDDVELAQEMKERLERLEEEFGTPGLRQAFEAMKVIDSEREILEALKFKEDSEQLSMGISEALNQSLSFSTWVLDQKSAHRRYMQWLEMELKEILAPLPPELGPTGSMAILRLGVQGADRLWQADCHAMMPSMKLLIGKVQQLCKENQGYEVSSTPGDFTLVFRQPAQAWAFVLALQADLLKIQWPEELLKLPDALQIYIPGPQPTYSRMPPQDVLLWSGLRVSCALNFGPLKEFITDDKRSGYTGAPLDCCNSLLPFAQGGQILVTDEFCQQLGGVEAIQGVKLLPLHPAFQARLDYTVWRAVSEALLPRELESRQFPTESKTLQQRWEMDRTVKEAQLATLEDAQKMAADTQTAITVLRNLLERQSQLMVKMKQKHAQLYSQMMSRTQILHAAQVRIDEQMEELTFLRALRATRDGESPAEAMLQKQRKEFLEKEKALKKDIASEKNSRSRAIVDLNMVRMQRDAMVSVYSPIQSNTVQFLRSCVEQFTELMKELDSKGTTAGQFDKHFNKPLKVDLSKYDGQIPEELIAALEAGKTAETEVAHSLAKCWSIVGQLRFKWQSAASASAAAAAASHANNQDNSFRNNQQHGPNGPGGQRRPTVSHRQLEGGSDENSAEHQRNAALMAPAPKPRKVVHRGKPRSPSAVTDASSDGFTANNSNALGVSSPHAGHSPKLRQPSSAGSEVPLSSGGFDGTIQHSRVILTQLEDALEGGDIPPEMHRFIPSLRGALANLGRQLDAILRRGEGSSRSGTSRVEGSARSKGSGSPARTVTGRTNLSSQNTNRTLGEARAMKSDNSEGSASPTAIQATQAIHAVLEPDPPPQPLPTDTVPDLPTDSAALPDEYSGPGLATMVENLRALRETFDEQPSEEILEKMEEVEKNIAAFSHFQKLPPKLRKGRAAGASNGGLDSPGSGGQKPNLTADMVVAKWDASRGNTEIRFSTNVYRDHMRGRAIELVPDEVREAMVFTPPPDEVLTPVEYKQSMWETLHLRKKKVPGQAVISQARVELGGSFPEPGSAGKATNQGALSRSSTLPPLRRSGRNK